MTLDPELLKQIELICPKCRRGGSSGIVQSSLRLSSVIKTDNGSITEGFLECSGCGESYPVVRGVPVILKDMHTWWSSQRPALSGEFFVTPELGKYFSALEQTDRHRFSERVLLSTYMDFHYGSCTDAPARCSSLFSPEKYWETVIGLARPQGVMRYEKALDIGCSVGRYAFELARFSKISIGTDIDFNKVSAAARFQQTQKITYERRKRGLYFDETDSPFLPPENTFFLVADALDPPFKAGAFDIVAGLNVIDNVGIPLVLLGQMNALLRQGGILLLSAPYEWNADTCVPAEWLETDEKDAPETVRSILEGKMFGRMELHYEVLTEHEAVPWALRNHSRHWSFFLTHIIKARKLSD